MGGLDERFTDRLNDHSHCISTWIDDGHVDRFRVGGPTDFRREIFRFLSGTFGHDRHFFPVLRAESLLLTFRFEKVNRRNQRVEQTLVTRFHSRVRLDRLDSRLERVREALNRFLRSSVRRQMFRSSGEEQTAN